MTNEELDQARAEHAWSDHYKGDGRDPTVIAARLAREGWTPPEPVDPEVGSIWKHYNGNVYEVIAIANTLDTEKYPKAVIHKNRANGTVWTRRADDWHRSYTQQAKTSETPVDPDIAETEKIFRRLLHRDQRSYDAILKAIKRGRELERAVMGNTIPEQIQEVTPPEPVDPDLLELETLWLKYTDGKLNSLSDVVLAGIKRGRALAAAETKPKGPQTAAFQAGSAGYRDWHDITHHAIPAPPEDVA